MLVGRWWPSFLAEGGGVDAGEGEVMWKVGPRGWVEVEFGLEGEEEEEEKGGIPFEVEVESW